MELEASMISSVWNLQRVAKLQLPSCPPFTTQDTNGGNDVRFKILQFSRLQNATASCS